MNTLYMDVYGLSSNAYSHNEQLFYLSKPFLQWGMVIISHPTLLYSSKMVHVVADMFMID